MDTSAGALNGLRVLDSPMEREIYAKDQAEVPEELQGIFLKGPPELIVQPRSEDEILRVLRYAESRGLPVIPRGAASSAYGGAIPAKGGIVLDLSLMRTILALDVGAGVVSVEAGVRWADLDDFLKGNGFALGSHPSSWFSTVAGWLSTGGYGLFSLRFGPFWRQVDWIRVVDFEGVRAISREDEEFENFVHTEGQMGIVVQLGLRVRPEPEEQHPLLFTASTAEEVLSFGSDIARDFQPVHMTYYDPARLREFNEVQGKEILEAAHSLLVVTEDEGEAQAISSYAEDRVGQAEHYQAAYLWEHRLFPMLVKKLGPGLLGTELLMKSSQVAGYLRRANRLAARFSISLTHEAHYVKPKEVLIISTFLTDQGQLEAYLPHLVFVLLLTRAGVRSGGRAYSVGLWNRPFLETRFSPQQLAGLRWHKRRVDPKGLLNPGKAFDDSRFVLKPWMLSLPFLTPSFLRAAGRVMSWIRDRPAVPRAETPAVADLRSAAECAHCSACITVCPAYLADRTELVTARGKLMAMERMLSGHELREDDALRLFDCIHCDACTNVCQSGIDLVPIWDRLETEVAERYGKPLAQIEDFARRVEGEEEYHDLVRKGLAYPLQTPRGGYKRV